VREKSGQIDPMIINKEIGPVSALKIEKTGPAGII
jgi:hypothetical protein